MAPRKNIDTGRPVLPKSAKCQIEDNIATVCVESDGSDKCVVGKSVEKMFKRHKKHFV